MATVSASCCLSCQSQFKFPTGEGEPGIQSAKYPNPASDSDPIVSMGTAMMFILLIMALGLIERD
jgi:hypothetical protein